MSEKPYVNDANKKTWFDANVKITNTGGCSFQSCSLKTSDCSANYGGSNLSLSGTKIFGAQNIAAGWSEEACLECIDPLGNTIQKKNTYTQAPSSMKYLPELLF